MIHGRQKAKEAGPANMAAVGQLSPSTLSLTLERVFDDAQHSGIVDLSCRNLKEYPKMSEEYDLTDTVETNLSKNRFLELPKEICCYLSSEVLNCYHNCLRSIPEMILNLQQLTYLNLSRNQLTQLPSYICQLQSLEVLLIRSNRLAALPEQLGLLHKLVQLDSSWNELELVPSQLGDLKSLRSLDLSHNALTDVPPELCKLKLRCLDLSSNRIQYIPLDYRAMDTLDRLALDNNPLVCPPAHICTKGRVHIMKYLHIVSLREDRRKGSLATDGYMSRRESGRRSMHRMNAADENGSRRAPGGLPMDSASRCESPGVAGPAAASAPAAGSRSPRHGSAAKQLPGLAQQQPPLCLGGRDTGSGASAGYAGGSSSRLSPVARATACPYGSAAAAPTSLQFAEAQQNYAIPTPPNRTPPVADDTNGASMGELLRQKQEYELKRRRASATTAEEQQQQQPATVGRGGWASTSPGAGSAAAAEQESTVPRQPCSAPAHLGGLKHVYSSSSLASEASRADTIMSIDSLSGFPVSNVPPSANGRPTGAQRSTTLAMTVAASSKPPVPDSRVRLSNGQQQQTTPYPTSAPWEASRGRRPQHEALAPSSAGGPQGISSDGIQRVPLVINESPDAAEALVTLKATLESRLNITLSDDLPNALRDGVVLCLLVNHIRPRSVAQIHMATAAVPKLTMAQCRRNMDNFIQACKRLGVPEEDVCTVSDVLDSRLPLLVAKTVESLCSRAARGAAAAPSAVGSAATHARPRPLRAAAAAAPAEPAGDWTAARPGPAATTAAFSGPGPASSPTSPAAPGGRVRKPPQSPSAV